MNPFDVNDPPYVLKLRKAANRTDRLGVSVNSSGDAVVSGPPQVRAFRASWPDPALGSRVTLLHPADMADKKPRNVWGAIVWYAIPSQGHLPYPDDLPDWVRPPDP